MNNPALTFHTPAQQTNAGWGRYVGIGLTLALNGLLIWALANGLATKITKYVPAVLETKVIDTPQAQPKPVTPPPAPQIEKVLPTEQTPEPVIQIAPDANAQTIQVQPQQQVPVQADASAAGVTSTHTTPPYPPVARRLGEQGTVILAITVAPDGSVSAAQVATSSGVPELDQAALNWVKAHWRYTPAMQGGVAVPSSTQAAVKFDLKQAR